MNSYFVFWFVFILLFAIIVICDKKFNLLRDVSDATKKPFSYSRVQMAWWTLIILSSFISIYLLTGRIPTFDTSSLILLGISAGTTVAASMIDVTDQSKNIKLSSDQEGDNFFLDILSDANGVSIHRLQTVIFNIIIGFWFIQQVNCHLSDLFAAIDTCVKNGGIESACRTTTLDIYVNAKGLANTVMPIVTQNNLILLGVSAGTYAALKTNENKPGMQSNTANTPNQPAPQTTPNNPVNVPANNSVNIPPNPPVNDALNNSVNTNPANVPPTTDTSINS